MTADDVSHDEQLLTGKSVMTKTVKPKRRPATDKKSKGRKAAQPPAKCPICGEPAVPEYFPFSSKRCAEVDLNRWLTGRYFIPAVESEPDDDTAADEDEG
jgi:endogenous inhibitor of DNA gyrase (YacG/DUF329 family)